MTAQILKKKLPSWKNAPDNANYLHQLKCGLYIWSEGLGAMLTAENGGKIYNRSELAIIRTYPRPKMVTYVHVGRENTYSIEGEFSYEEVIKFLNEERIEHDHTVVLIEYKDEQNLPKN